MHACVPGFTCTKCGFHFADNAFPLGTLYPAPVIGTSDAHDGICDGLVLTVLDLFRGTPTRVPPPDVTGPASTTDLFAYLTKRECSCWTSSSYANTSKAVDWWFTSRHDTWFRHGLSRKMANNEWPDIKLDIDNGSPSPLWLVPQGMGLSDSLKKHQQVLAYCYDLNEATNDLTLRVYDPQKPDSETETVQLNISNPSHTIEVTSTSYLIHPKAFFWTGYDLSDASAVGLLPPVGPISGVPDQSQFIAADIESDPSWIRNPNNPNQHDLYRIENHLAWTPASGAQWYTLERRLAGDADFLPCGIGRIVGTKHIDIVYNYQVSAGDVMRYRVCAWNGAGAGNYSDVLEIPFAGW